MVFGAEDLLRAFEERVQQQAEHASQLSEQMKARSVTVESPGGEVRVTVDTTGGLSGLEFGSAAERLRLEGLAQLVLQTSRQAQAKLAESMSELVGQMYGPSSPTARFVSDAYAERFPTAEPDEDGERR